jgi:hypothetical protein
LSFDQNFEKELRRLYWESRKNWCFHNVNSFCFFVFLVEEVLGPDTTNEYSQMLRPLSLILIIYRTWQYVLGCAIKHIFCNSLFPKINKKVSTEFEKFESALCQSKMSKFLKCAWSRRFVNSRNVKAACSFKKRFIKINFKLKSFRRIFENLWEDVGTCLTFNSDFSKMLADDSTDFWELWSQAMKTLLQGLARNEKLKENKS